MAAGSPGRRQSARKRGWSSRSLLRQVCARSNPDESGFNLVELILVITMMPLVIGGVSVAVITSFQDQSGLQSRLTDSNDSITSTAYFNRDVQSSTSVTTSSSTLTSTHCSDNRSPAPSPILGMQLGTTSTGVVAYDSWAPAPSPGNPTPSTELLRFTCLGGTLTSSTIMSHNIATTGTQPTLPCSSSYPNCSAATTWTPTYEFSTISLGVTQGPGSTGLQYQLVGAPLSQPTITVSQPTAGPLLLLGSGSDIFNPLAFGDTISVSGAINLDSNGTPAIVFLFSSGNKVESTGSGGVIDVYNCGSPCGSNAVAEYFAGGDTVTPSPVNSTYVGDPPATWKTTTPPLPSKNVSCTTLLLVETCPSGIYPNGLTVPSGVTVDFTGGGPFQFGTKGCSNCSLTFSGNDTANFLGGDFTFYGGLNVSGDNDTLCSGTVVLGTCQNPLGADGVLFYVAGGSASFGDTFGTNTVELAPQTSGTYANVSLWQDTSDRNQLTLISAGGSSVNTFGGELYAPNGTILVIGLGNTLDTGPIVAQSLTMAGNYQCTLNVS